jgi:uncharacterized protein YkwD
VLAVAPAAGARSTSAESALLGQLNAVRAAHGLVPLRVDARLVRAARFHSREMIADGAFEHGAFAARMARFRVTGSLARENLAWGTGARGTARGVVTAWLASPEHRANLLRPSFRRIGIGDLTGAFQGHAGARVITADFAG